MDITNRHPDAHYFLSLPEGQNNGSKSAGPPEESALKIFATGTL